MRPFDSRFFGSLAEEDWAKEVWEFLNEPENVRRMELVSLLGHPALEAVVLDLEQGWGQHFGQGGDRARQMVGGMIKAVLEDEGWEIESQGLKIQLGHQFSVATRYQRRAVPSSAPEEKGGTFLSAVARRYAVPNHGRHYILIPCAGVTIAVDELKREGIRRIQVFTDKKARAQELSGIVPQVQDVASGHRQVGLIFVDRHGEKNHERRYLGWEWKAVGRTIGDDLELACDLVEALRKAWLSRA